MTNTFGEKGEIKKVVVCSGKVYFDIHEKLTKTQPDHKVLVIRLEELAPFPIRNIR